MKPKKNSWLAVREDALTKSQNGYELLSDLQKKISQVEVWISDLDKTHAPSAPKKIVLNAVGTSHFDKDYLKWALGSILPLSFAEKEKKYERWQMYLDNFMREREVPFNLKENVKQELEEMFNQEKIKEYLFKGVEDFLTLLPENAKKYYFSGSLDEVVGKYAQHFNFDGFRSEAYYKEVTLQDFIDQNPQFENYGFEGDSDAEAIMAEVLEFNNKNYFGIQVMKSPSKELLIPGYDYATSEDRTELNKALKFKFEKLDLPILK